MEDEKENNSMKEMKGADRTVDLPVNESESLKGHEYSEIKPYKKSSASPQQKKSPPPSVLRHTFEAKGAD
jgi:hypothetical protein